MQTIFNSDYYKNNKQIKNLEKKQNKLMYEVYFLRSRQISEENSNFQWTEEDIEKLNRLNNFLQLKMQELFSRLDKLTVHLKKLESDDSELFNEYEISGELYYEENDFYFSICKICFSSYHPLQEDDKNDYLTNNFIMPYKKANLKICRALYIILEEHKMSFNEAVNAKTDDFCIQLKVEI